MPAPSLFVFAFCLLVAMVPALAETHADVTGSQKIAGEALKARAAQQPAEYLKRMQDAFLLRPSSPGVMLRLAGAYSVNGDKANSLPLLERLARMGLAYAIGNDADFAGMKDDAAFRAIVEAMAANRKPLVKSEPAFELAEKDFLAEGLAYDNVTRAFFVSSVHQRKIVKRLWTGDVKPLSISADGLWSVLAVAVDARRRVLWATSSALDQTRDVDDKDLGRTALFKYDLDKEERVGRYELPRSAVKRSFGDLLIAANGDVYISESMEGGIYRLSGDKLETFIAPGTFISPQGMAWSDTGEWLYVADYSLGLLRVNMATRMVESLPAPADSCLLGLDALTRAGNKLIATQNGINPHRVVEIALTPSGHVAGVTTLEANHPRHREPTLGVVVGSDFYYVANSQWDFFERGKPLPLDKLVAPLILRLPLRNGPNR